MFLFFDVLLGVVGVVVRGEGWWVVAEGGGGGGGAEVAVSAEEADDGATSIFSSLTGVPLAVLETGASATG